MSPARPQLSITLPRNFTFHYTDGQDPRTPERDEIPQQSQPAPPKPYRLRARRRPGLTQHHLGAQTFTGLLPKDTPVPSIEAPQWGSSQSQASTSLYAGTQEGLLAPESSRPRFVTPPKTPVPQNTVTDNDGPKSRYEWSRPDEEGSIGSASRPASPCSIFSDSSFSSSKSSISYPSTGGRCITPDTGGLYQIDTPSHAAKAKVEMEPEELMSGAQGGVPLRSRWALKQPKWTDEMDVHLWTTYVRYLQDPTVTPFRVGPGRAPPLGVCHRVAREAKRTWRGSKVLSSDVATGKSAMRRQSERHVLRDVFDEANAMKSDFSPSSLTSGRSGSLTPTGPGPQPQAQQYHHKWPCSDSATRRRLRDLCKQKPHRNRLEGLLQSRSPPSGSQSRPRLASPFGGYLSDQPSFSTGDMALSLMTSTCSTMQPDGALARLGQESSTSDQQDEGWFGRPLSTPQAGSSQLSSQGLGTGGIGNGTGSARLASPFNPQRPTGDTQAFQRHPSGSSTIPRAALRSPIRFTSATMPLHSALKRRAPSQLVEDDLSPEGSDMRRNLIEELIGYPIHDGHRRVRSRGFSLGDVSAAAQLSSLFAPPSDHGRGASSDLSTIISGGGSSNVQQPSTAHSRFGSLHALGPPLVEFRSSPWTAASADDPDTALPPPLSDSVPPSAPQSTGSIR